MRKVLSVLACTVAIGATPLLGQTVNPVGQFEFETVVQGQTVGGTMQIEGTDGMWTGRIIAEGQGEMPINGVEVDGMLVTIFSEIPEAGELIIEIEFEGDEFTGSWVLGFDGGELVGRRIN